MKLNTPKTLAILALAAGSLTALGSCGQAGAGGTTNRPMYTINFFSDGGTSVSSMKAYEGDKLTKPTDPSRANYAFLGWYDQYRKNQSEYQSLTQFDWTVPMPAKNFTLYAAWTKKEQSSHTAGEVDEYMAELAKTSQDGHLYYHYYRYGNANYNDWDVWAWPYKPDAGEGTRFDWNGRTTSADRMSASGDALYDDLGGTYVDIDLNAHYKSGWDAENQKMLDKDMTFADSTHVGLQIVKSSTRTSASGFWVNDGSNVYITLKDYAMPLDNGGTAYHVFVIQDQVYMPLERPESSDAKVDPFEDDDGTNVTYGDKKYDNIDWSPISENAKTASDFLNTGVGYQIMVSSFADSDADGWGDIYGIVQKLDYLEKLGVKALWLTPVQLSDSYHGYDITDYEKVDPKYGSSRSPAGIANEGEVTEETAMEDYKLLVDEAHKRGMKIVMDLVLNHTSTANTWFSSSANLSADYRGYYQWGNNVTQAANINENKFWYPYGDHVYSYYAKFGSAMPELNYSYRPTREAVRDMSTFWAKDIGVDGFRLDAVKHIYMLDEISSYQGDTTVIDETTVSGRKVSYSSDLTKNLHFYKELKVNVSKDAGRDIFFVGENFDGHAYHVAPYYEAFDSMFDFYAYFNLTSAAKTGMGGTTSGYGTAGGWLTNASTFTKGQSSGGSGDNGGKDFDLANGKAWNFVSVYDTYNAYRAAGGGAGQVSLPGAFTSNHDIARVINRIAGKGDATGISAQGNVSTSEYDKYATSAQLVKIAEIMLPGLTWVYYGDEIGMTGNFPAGKDSQSSYADLWYRQPMKWVANGTKGDEAGSTDYHVTDGGDVLLDDTNKSDKVVPALTQQNQENSQFGVLAKFIKIKNEKNNNLVTGNMKAGNWVYGETAANVLQFSRDNDTFRVVVNFNKDAVSINNDRPFENYNVVASYNGASASSLPGFSAMVLKKK